MIPRTLRLFHSCFFHGYPVNSLQYFTIDCKQFICNFFKIDRIIFNTFVIILYSPPETVEFIVILSFHHLS